MALTILTEVEKRWRKTARRAIDQGETWEPCDDCLRYHPAGYEGSCDDPQNRLPWQPSEIIG
jgi:hypothetical protein